jgi:homoserine kinase
MALNIYNRVTVAKSQAFRLHIAGEGADKLPSSQDNPICRAIAKAYEEAGEPLPPLSISCHNNIPLKRGLGSSAAAIVAGLVAANMLLGEPLPQGRLLELAWQMEGHPDNVAACLLGGCQIVVAEGSRLICSRVPINRGWWAALLIPDFEIATAQARAILPQRVSRADAIYNIGHTALLVNALVSGNAQQLKVAVRDRLHQPYRRALFPAMDSLFGAALDAGADGVFLSASGPAVLALGSKEHVPAIAAAMLKAAQEEKLAAVTKLARPVDHGVQVISMA